MLEKKSTDLSIAKIAQFELLILCTLSGINLGISLYRFIETSWLSLSRYSKKQQFVRVPAEQLRLWDIRRQFQIQSRRTFCEEIQNQTIYDVLTNIGGSFRLASKSLLGYAACRVRNTTDNTSDALIMPCGNTRIEVLPNIPFACSMAFNKIHSRNNQDSVLVSIQSRGTNICFHCQKVVQYIRNPHKITY